MMVEQSAILQSLGIESGSYDKRWRCLGSLDSSAFDTKLQAAGWNFFFMATEVKVMFLGFLAPKKIEIALKRILEKVKPQHFNGLEITEIIARRFLGVRYVTVSAHSRHMQQSCNLDSPEGRRTSQNDAAWARG